MDIHKAKTTAPLIVRSIFRPAAPVLILEDGSEVTAIRNSETGSSYHVNAEVDGVLYDGYCPKGALELGELLGTVNESVGLPL